MSDSLDSAFEEAYDKATYAIVLLSLVVLIAAGISGFFSGVACGVLICMSIVIFLVAMYMLEAGTAIMEKKAIETFETMLRRPW